MFQQWQSNVTCAIGRDYFKGVSSKQARKCKQAYYACNSFVDAQVGPAFGRA